MVTRLGEVDWSYPHSSRDLVTAIGAGASMTLSFWVGDLNSPSGRVSDTTLVTFDVRDLDSF